MILSSYAYRKTGCSRRLILIFPVFLIFYLASSCQLHAQVPFPDSSDIEVFSSLGDLSGELLTGKLRTRREKLMPLSKPANESRLQIARANNKVNGIAVAANNLGLIAYREGNPEKALAYFEEALKAREAMDDSHGTALIKGEIGFLYYFRKEYNQAISYLKASNDQLRALNIPKGTAITAMLLGETYFRQKEYDKAVESYLEAITAYTGLDDKKSAGTILHKAGQARFLQRKLGDAGDFFNSALKTATLLNDSNLIARTNRSLGYLYLYQDDYLKAESFLLTSLKYKPNAALTEKYLKETYSKLAARYKVENNNERAFYYNQRYQELKDRVDQKNAKAAPVHTEVDEQEQQLHTLNRQGKQDFTALTPNQLEMKQLMTATELERLNQERAMEDLNRSLNLSEQVRYERDMEIEKLKDEKSQLDLILAQNEKELYRRSKNNIILLASTLLVIVFAFFIYNRYRLKRKSLAEINHAYAELKATQEQLIQSEKMASLGQLTAGIAHEIQNPLNFVTNFSELNAELLDELTITDSESERKEIIGSLKENFHRITEHGRRADSIVKGMLAHSRPYDQEKHPVDINRICDDFFNLAYHGMRAKDSSFNCSMVKILGEGIPPVLAIQQDISRVLLNLLNNAFYAVNQKVVEELKKGNTSYKPEVRLETYKNADHVFIKITDNGNGIPDTIIRKIFQPFFTTKPSGQGTGLGLSLSYDIIVKGHQGDLQVTSSIEKGTVFTILLPIHKR